MSYRVLGKMADTVDRIVFKLAKLNINEGYPKEMPPDRHHGRYLLAAVYPGDDFDDYLMILCPSTDAARKVYKCLITIRC